jgi:glycosyltransferase involved in cell wall biosynthesis
MSVSQNSSKSPIRILMMGTSLKVKGGVTSVEKLIIDHAPQHLKITHVATIDQGSAYHNILVFAKSIGSLCLSILRRDADIVHIHFSERGSTLRKSILILIGLIGQQSIVLHAHGATYAEFFAGLPSFCQKLLIALFRRCTKIIVLSESWQEFYTDKLTLAKNQVAVLYNPVNVPMMVPDRQRHQPVKFIFLGRIGKRGGALDMAKSLISFPKQDKGAFDLIHAFAALPVADRQQAELVLAGNGDLAAANQLIADLHMTEQITILDWLNSTQRDELLGSADAFVLPSYNEGLPMSMLEAMAWGLPVIVTPVGGIPEVVVDHKNGLLVEPGNIEQIMPAMQLLIQNAPLRLSLGTAARYTAKDLDIRNYMDSLADLYDSALPGK